MMMDGKIRVGVLFGGRSGEHEVSLMSARSVLDAINPDKYSVTEIGISHQGDWYVGDHVWKAMNQNKLTSLTRAAIFPEPARCGLYSIRTSIHGDLLEHLTDLDVVFPVLHGTFGEDGTLQGFFEMADLAYVGAGVLGSSVGMDKSVFKDVMRSHQIPVVDWFVTTRNDIENKLDLIIEKAIKKWDYPIFVKPANLGSSVGISRCTSRADLLEGLMDAARYDRRIIIEQGFNAREIEVSVLGNDNPQSSIPGEVIPGREFYSYESKYLDDDSQLLIPAPISSELSHHIRKMAVLAYRAIDCAGMARVDFLLTRSDSLGSDTGTLYLNELNTIPGFTEISMYSKLWQASGLPYTDLIDRLIDLALERKAERDRTERKFQRGTQK